MFEDIKKRRLTLGELLRLSVAAFSRNLSGLLAVVACVYLPVNIMSEHITGFITGSAAYQDLVRAAAAGSLNPQEYIDDIGNFAPMFLMMTLIDIVFIPLSLAAYTYIADEAARGRKAAFSGILDASLMKWARLIATYALYALFMLIGSFLLIIPGVIMAVSMTFCVSFAALTDKWGVSALNESRRLIKGNWFRTLGVLFVSWLISLPVAYVLTFLKSYLPGIPLLSPAYDTLVQFPLSIFSLMPIFYFLNMRHLREGAGPGRDYTGGSPGGGDV